MKQLRLPFIIVLVLAVGLLGGMVLEMHVLSRVGSPEEPDEDRETPQDAEDRNEDYLPPWAESPTDGDELDAIGSMPVVYEGPLWLIWVEARLIEIARAELDEIVIGEGDAAVPVDEKVLLTAEQRTWLLEQFRSKPSYRSLGRASVTTISGNQVLIQCVDDVPYLSLPLDTQVDSDGGSPPEDKPTEFRLGLHAEPGSRNTLSTGLRLNATPIVSSDRRVITLVMLPEMCTVTGWLDLGEGLPLQPAVRTWDVTTTLYIRPGMSVLMPCGPAAEFGGVPHPGAKPTGGPEQETTVLVLVTARLVELPEQLAESGPPESPPPDKSTPGDDTGERLEP